MIKQTAQESDYNTSIQNFIRVIEELDVQEADFQRFGKWLHQQDLSSLTCSLESLAPAAGTAKNNYLKIKHKNSSRMEISTVIWHPKVSSAIHEHSNFWGYVIILKGKARNTEYTLDKGILSVLNNEVYYPSTFFVEPDRAIHKISNETNQCLLTLHLYYPELTSYEGMRIFDDNCGKIGVLNALAKSASWSEPMTHFENIQENAFQIK